MENPFSNLTDEELMMLYQQDEAMAFDVLYGRHKNKIYTYLSKRMGDQAAIHDIFQNILLKIHKSRSNYNSKYPVLSWIYTISRSELLDYLKKQKVTSIPFNEQYMGEQLSIPNPALELFHEKLLTKNEKEAISLRFYSDNDFIEISKELNTSESNVRKIISRGLKKLRLKYIGDNSEES